MGSPSRRRVVVRPSDVGWFHFLWPLFPSAGSLLIAYLALEQGNRTGAAGLALTGLGYGVVQLRAARRGARLTDEELDRIAEGR